MLLELLVFGGASYVVRSYRHFQPKRNKPTEQPSCTSVQTLSQKQLQKREERLLQEDFIISSSSLGLSVLGYFFSPSLYVLSLAGWIYVSIPVFKRAYHLLWVKKVDVNTIFTITFIGCFAAKYYATGNLAAFFYVLSNKLFYHLNRKSQQSLVDVFGQHDTFVWVLIEGVEVKIPFEDIKQGDTLIVGAGETIPADGIIVAGSAGIDQHILTGEAQPVEKELGDSVFAATMILSGSIHLQVEKAGDASTAAQIGKILEQTTHFKTSGQRRADELTNRAIIPTLVLGGLSLPFIGPLGAVTVINAHFGYRMSVVSSVVMLKYLQEVSHLGILIKNGEVLDDLPKVDTIVFDKTGTLTLAQPSIGNVYTAENYDEETILAYAAAAENKQTHPIALAILAAAEARGLIVPVVTERMVQVGYGLSVIIDCSHIRLGSMRFMLRENIHISDYFTHVAQHADVMGHSLVMLAIDKNVVGAIELQTTVRPEAKAVIAYLKQEKLVKTTYIISGDSEAPTKKLASELNIDHYFASVLPQQKAEIIAQLQSEGKTVCYIGDGINDTIALKKAQVSISMRGASSVATDTAQIILMNENLTQLCHLLQSARQFDETMERCYHTILTPSIIAAGGALFLGFNLMDTVLLKQLGLTLSLLKAVQPIEKDQYRILGESTTPTITKKASNIIDESS